MPDRKVHPAVFVSWTLIIYFASVAIVIVHLGTCKQVSVECNVRNAASNA